MKSAWGWTWAGAGLVFAFSRPSLDLVLLNCAGSSCSQETMRVQHWNVGQLQSHQSEVMQNEDLILVKHDVLGCKLTDLKIVVDESSVSGRVHRHCVFLPRRAPPCSPPLHSINAQPCPRLICHSCCIFAFILICTSPLNQLSMWPSRRSNLIVFVHYR